MHITFTIDIERTPKTSPLFVAALPVLGAWLASMLSPKPRPANPVVDWSVLIDRFMRDRGEDAPSANGAQPPHASGAV